MVRRAMGMGLAAVAITIAACSSGDSASTSTGAGAASASSVASSATSSATATAGSTGASASSSAASSSGSGGGSPTITTAVITSRHRFVPNKMFGGWGPHLGHMVRAGTGASSALWFVDDACSQSGADVCDVNRDLAIAYSKETAGVWTKVKELALPGTIQQNTGTIVAQDGATFYSYGLDVAAHAIVECAFTVASETGACNDLAITVPPLSNYIGAAISPQGYRMVWWTRVADGGNGDFEFIVNYGQGWNGPRTGGIGGFNDASYINIAFGGGANQSKFTMHGELVSGLAPSWTFIGGVGTGDASVGAPVAWATTLASPKGDPIESTNDVFIDPETNDEHLVARAHSGAAVYYHRKAGGSWSAPLFTLPKSYRVRFAVASDAVYLVYGVAKSGLALRAAPKAARAQDQPIDWASLPEVAIPLPQGYDDLYAIYPEAPAYQLERASSVNVAVVGTATQNEALSVTYSP